MARLQDLQQHQHWAADCVPALHELVNQLLIQLLSKQKIDFAIQKLAMQL
jgi:hypothetical protein